MGAPDVTINVGMLMTKELNYKGSFRYGVSNILRVRTNWVLMHFSSLATTRWQLNWLPKARLT